MTDPQFKSSLDITPQETAVAYLADAREAGMNDTELQEFTKGDERKQVRAFVSEQLKKDEGPPEPVPLRFVVYRGRRVHPQGTLEHSVDKIDVQGRRYVQAGITYTMHKENCPALLYEELGRTVDRRMARYASPISECYVYVLDVREMPATKRANNRITLEEASRRIQALPAFQDGRIITYEDYLAELKQLREDRAEDQRAMARRYQDRAAKRGKRGAAA